MKALGIILAGGNSVRMKELSKKRAIAALPVAGAYRGIDFALSSMSNSNINRVAVLTQYNARSLNKHLMSSKWWDFGRKQGGLYVFTPTVTLENNWWYRGTADAIYQNIDWLKECHEPYVVIASGDGVYKMDFNKVLEYHIAKRADVTVVCTECKENDTERFGVLKLNEEFRVEDFEEKPVVAKSRLISTGIYVIRRRLLIEMIEKSISEERFDLVKDIFIRYKDVKRIYGYKTSDYWSNISTLDAYIKTNKDFLKDDVRAYFFKKYPGVYSKVDDLPPAKYNPGSEVKNSLISSGCIVNGKVEDSVISKDVYIGNNCTIKNSIILHNVYIGDNAYIENCIVESQSTIPANEKYVGEGETKVVIAEGERFRI